MSDSAPVDRAVEDARTWARQLGPAWVARFDQLHADVRRWAERVGVDPGSYEFRAAWCVAATFLHDMARMAEEEAGEEPGDLSHQANVFATVGLWTEAGIAGLSAGRGER